MDFKKIMRITINKNLQLDTIAGILITVIMITLLFYSGVPQFNTTLSTSFIVFSVVAVIINIIIDYTSMMSKYALLDSLLFLVMLFLFSYVMYHHSLQYLSSINSFTVDESVYELRDITGATYYISYKVGNLFNLKLFLQNFTFWNTFILTFSSLYGFLTRNDSRMKSSKHRTSLFSILENSTKAATIYPNRGGPMSEAARVIAVEETKPSIFIDEILEKNRSDKELKSKK